MSFDASAQPPAADACEAGHSFEPHFPDSALGIGATITVRGPYAPVVLAYEQRKLGESQQRLVAARQAGRAASAEPLSIAGVIDANLDKAVAVTLGWQGIERDGAALPFSESAARWLYTQHPWLAVQVNEEAAALGKFIGPSKSSSSSTPAPSSAST